MLRWRSGYSLAELAIVLVTLIVVAIIIVPRYAVSIGSGRARAMTDSVQYIRSMIDFHASAKDVPLSDGGYPLEIEPTWFLDGSLPHHAWTGAPMNIKVVQAPAEVVYPRTKLFFVNEPDCWNAWYNATNGAFCVLVGSDLEAEEILESFNLANDTDLQTIDEVTREGS